MVKFTIVSGVTAAHVQLRAKFKSKFKIRKGDQELEMNDLVVSFEAARPVDISYNFALGVVDNYLLVGRVASGEQRSKEYGDKYNTEQYRLNLKADESRQLILSAVQRSHDIKLTKFYNTLKPNCATEVFDLIDRLPSQEGKNSPFLTVISNDPVAGPTIAALGPNDRNILDRRFSDLNDELNTGSTKAPKEDSTPQGPPLLPAISGYPYSIVIAAPEENEGNAVIVKEAKSLAYELAPELAQRLGASLMLSGFDTSASLLATLADLPPVLLSHLKKINSKLSDQPVNLALYFTPWDSKLGTAFDPMKDLEVQARLPFAAFETSIFDAFSLNEIYAGLNDAAFAHSQNTIPFGLMGLAVQFHLVKDGSLVSLQAVGHPGALTKDVAIDNAQVKLSSFEIPKALSEYTVPVAVLNLSQSISEKFPRMNLSFGNFGGVYQGPDDTKFGQLTVKSESGDQSDETCLSRRFSSPKLKGKAVIKGKTTPITVLLDIFSVDFDLEKQIVKNMDVRVSTGLGVAKNCESDENINLEFTNSANAQIKDQKDKHLKSPGLSVLNQILSNNPQGKVSGFIAE